MESRDFLKEHLTWRQRVSASRSKYLSAWETREADRAGKERRSAWGRSSPWGSKDGRNSWKNSAQRTTLKPLTRWIAFDLSLLRMPSARGRILSYRPKGPHWPAPLAIPHPLLKDQSLVRFQRRSIHRLLTCSIEEMLDNGLHHKAKLPQAYKMFEKNLSIIKTHYHHWDVPCPTWGPEYSMLCPCW